MAFNFQSDEERLALEANDVDTYPQMGLIHRARFYSRKERFKLCRSAMSVTSTDHSGQPLTVDYLQQFADALGPFRGNWYIRWYGNERQPEDVDLDDNFRGVVAFGTLDFNIRPMQNDAETPKLR